MSVDGQKIKKTIGAAVAGNSKVKQIMTQKDERLWTFSLKEFLRNIWPECHLSWWFFNLIYPINGEHSVNVTLLSCFLWPLKFKRHFYNRIFCIIIFGACRGIDFIWFLSFSFLWMPFKIYSILTHNKINVYLYSSVAFNKFRFAQLPP